MSLKTVARIYLNNVSWYQERQTIKTLKFMSSVPPLVSFKRWVGILTDYPSTAAFAIALGPPNPPPIYVAEETLDFRGAGFSPALRLLMPTFSLPNTPPHFTVRLQRIRNALLPYRLSKERRIRVFGALLSPDKFSAPLSLNSELLHTL